MGGTSGKREENWEEVSRCMILPANSEQVGCAVIRRVNWTTWPNADLKNMG